MNDALKAADKYLHEHFWNVRPQPTILEIMAAFADARLDEFIKRVENHELWHRDRVFPHEVLQVAKSLAAEMKGER